MIHPAALLRILTGLSIVAGGLIFSSYQKALRLQAGPVMESPKEAVVEAPMSWPALAKLVEGTRKLSFKALPGFVGMPGDEVAKRQQAIVENLHPGGAGEIKVRIADAFGYRWQPAYPIEESLSGLLLEEDGCAFDEKLNIIYFDQNVASERASALKGKWLTLLGQILVKQNFPASAKEPLNDDARLAAAAVVMADARQTMLKCVVGGSSANAVSGNSDASNTPVPFSATPPFFRERFLFPSAYGPFYLDALQAADNFAGLNSLCQSPPKSTAEIMHPRMSAFEPEKVELPSAEILGQRPILQNVLGEFGTFLLLKSQLQHERSAIAAEGWRGDGYAIYEAPKSNDATMPRDHLLWITRWDNEQEAAEFQDVLSEYILARLGLEDAPEFHEIDETFCISGHSRSVFLRTDPADFKRVILIHAASDAFRDALRALVFPEKN